MKEIGANEGIEGCLGRRVIATHVYVFFDEGVRNKHDHCSVCDECWVKNTRDKMCLPPGPWNTRNNRDVLKSFSLLRLCLCSKLDVSYCEFFFGNDEYLVVQGQTSSDKFTLIIG